MVKIGMAKGRLSVAAPRLKAAGRVEIGDRTRPDWHRWYNTQGWRRLRSLVLERDLFTCRMCGRIEADTSQLVADHVLPHRGDDALFWDAGNVQTLCKGCHDGAKQKGERGI